jgi:hypothetical protein
MRKFWIIPVLAIALLLLASQAQSAPQSPPTLVGCPLFPPDNVWNVPIDTLPVDSNSNAYVNTIGANAHVHADFGSGDWPPGSGSPIGIPYTTVITSQPKVAINFTGYGDESDAGPYPVPTAAPIEGGPASDGDRHVLVVRQGECKLYELYYAFPNGDGSWDASSGAVYTLTQNGPLRPDDWTSADAAGLPILPGLVRYDEVAAGEINHAIRFTAPQTRNTHIWPARHDASSRSGSQYPPMGQRFRLKASFVIDNSFSHDAQVILRALKKYGMVLADNGSSWYLSGAPDPNWDNDVLHELDVVKGSDFEAIDESSLMVNPNSGQVVHGLSLSASPAARSIDPGQSAVYQVAVAPFGYFSGTVDVQASSPSPSVTLSWSPSNVTPPALFTLTLTDTHSGSIVPGLWYSLPITVTGGSLTKTTTIGLLVGGVRVYLPIILKQ